MFSPDNLYDIQARIAAAEARAKRPPGSVTLVAVSKTFPPEIIDEAISAGARVIGENRVQEAAAKIPLCRSAEWHLIGPLQSNKIRAALQLFTTIHSVDSVQLLRDIARISAESGIRPRLLLEVNVAGEASKFGFKPDTIRAGLETALSFPDLDVAGLMTLPPFVPDPELSRPRFAKLRELRDALEHEFGASLPELSMGMSGDYEIAIEEGATLVRIGSALFGRRQNTIRPIGHI
ncbi:MAG: YggS family pyridoxal phosphate-dependent enzyme [Kiritimatiellaeota bacterium]|nr:YggS family pyridoxal phosphate-dependent enzyme [Kiritimatiellota bacterium]